MEEEKEEEMEELPFDSRRINKNDITLETWPKGQTASQLTGWSVHSQLLSANNFISQIYGQLLEITKRREKKKIYIYRLKEIETVERRISRLMMATCPLGGLRFYTIL